VASRRQAFTLIELLVVVAIIALLLSILVPSFAQARQIAHRTVCSANQHNLVIAAISYTLDNREWFNPMQDAHVDNQGRSIEGTWRVYLWDKYIGNDPSVVDCPAEENERYADGLSLEDIYASRGRPDAPPPRAENPKIYGKLHRYEIFNASGIGANLAHYWVGMEGHGPFGRPQESGYPEGLTRAGANVVRSAQLILFGDGHGDAKGDWAEDRFWIFFWDPPLPPQRAGYDRTIQGDPGAVRHLGKANYGFYDGSVRVYEASDIPCDFKDEDGLGQCWWSVELYPHGPR